MDERAALKLVGERVPAAGDDAAVVDGTVLTTDMLHDRTDFPDGITRYTAGWRAVGASLSDVAGMGASATAAVAVYAAPTFDPDQIAAFVDGASDVCSAVDCEYVGGDLDQHTEFTVATTALGATDDPVYRSGASPGEKVCVTGSLGRTAAALSLFEVGETERGNELFRFTPRVAAGRAVAADATAMMDSSDGLARSLHQLAEASDCGFAVDSEAIPLHGALEEVVPAEERLDLGISFGEDFELVFTVPGDAVAAVEDAAPVSVSVVGDVVPEAEGVTLDGEPLDDEGYTHGG